MRYFVVMGYYFGLAMYLVAERTVEEVTKDVNAFVFGDKSKDSDK